MKYEELDEHPCDPELELAIEADYVDLVRFGFNRDSLWDMEIPLLSEVAKALIRRGKNLRDFVTK